MSKRKYNFSTLTEQQLTEIAVQYPKAVITTIRPNYRVMAMLVECGVTVPHLDSGMGNSLHEPAELDLPPVKRKP